MKSKSKHQTKFKNKFEIEIDKRKELAEEEESLRIVDISEKEGRKFIKETEDAKFKAEKNTIADYQTSLQSKQHQHHTYKRTLAEFGLNLLNKLDLDKGWEYYCVPTDKGRINIFGKSFDSKDGILLILKSPKGNVYTRGIKVINDPLYDTRAMGTLVEQVENTIDAEKGILLEKDGTKKTKTGIYLP